MPNSPNSMITHNSYLGNRLCIVGCTIEEGEAGDGLGGRVLEDVEVLAGLGLGVAGPHAAQQASHL